jgi:hypothetical protein
VERLDDLRREDRRGQEPLPAVDHQVEVDVAAVDSLMQHIIPKLKPTTPRLLGG